MNSHQNYYCLVVTKLRISESKYWAAMDFALVEIECSTKSKSASWQVTPVLQRFRSVGLCQSGSERFQIIDISDIRPLHRVLDVPFRWIFLRQGWYLGQDLLSYRQCNSRLHQNVLPVFLEIGNGGCWV